MMHFHAFMLCFQLAKIRTHEWASQMLGGEDNCEKQGTKKNHKGENQRKAENEKEAKEKKRETNDSKQTKK
jgi:hypothetical protein